MAGFIGTFLTLSLVVFTGKYHRRRWRLHGFTLFDFFAHLTVTNVAELTVGITAHHQNTTRKYDGGQQPSLRLRSHVHP